MTPLRISLEGFMSYRERQTFDFDGAPLWVLAGPNGAGKSAVFEAITVALYGRYRGKGKANKDLIHHDADALVVEFDFLLNGETFRLRRTIPRRGRPTYAAFRLIPADSGDETHIEPISETETETGLKTWVNRKIGLSYKTFISSVLLMQGRSEELLNADPRDRYDVLSELIDLSLYQQLHERANDLRRQRETQAKLLSQQLKSAPAITEEELEAARQKVAQTEAEWQVAQAKVDESAKLLGQAKQWELLSRESVACQNEARQAQALLEREPEITSGYERLRQLEQVLPVLGQILAHRERLAEREQTLSRLNQDIAQAEPELESIHQARLAAEADVARLEAEVDESQRNLRALTARLSEFEPLLQRLDQWEKTQAEAQNLQAQMAALPPNLSQLLFEAETRERGLNELAQALPWLKQLAEARSALARSGQEIQLAQAELKELNDEFDLEAEKLAQLKDDIEAAQDAERSLAQEIARAQTRSQDASQRRNRFAEAATQPTCELCGQEITPAHVELEKRRLAERAVAAETRLKEVTGKHQQAEARLEELEGSFAEQSQLLNSLAQKRNQIQTRLGNSRRDADIHLKQLENAFVNLPPAFQDRVRSSGASADLSTTGYPADGDLSALTQEAVARQSHAQHLQRLRKQSEEWQRLDAQLQAAERRLANLGLREQLTEALRARDERRKLEARLKELETVAEQRSADLKRARQSADQYRSKMEELRQALAQRKADAQAAQATCEEIARNVQSQIAALPDIWRPQAEIFDRQMLKDIEAERDKLRGYEALFSDLSQARQSLDSLEQRISGLQAQIADLPLPARRAAVEIEREIKAAHSQRAASDMRRREAGEQLAELEAQQRHRQETERQHLASERAFNLYKTLAQLLGPGGLQLTLLRRAERMITALANEVLEGLSRGQMRLELRGAEGDEELSEKALDLIVYNYETGTQPLPVALVSGSQRFRIAVSLALAVGRYAGEEARAIESVIIDEGFGCLDTNGRDDMIQELNRLQEQLSRILLVSHQEEFARSFSNGYAIALVNGASQVSLR